MKLTEEQFHQTLKAPMKLIGPEEGCGVGLKRWIEEWLPAEGIKTPLAELVIPYCYKSGDGIHEQVLFYYGEEERFLVVVVNAIQKEVVGYYMLDMVAFGGM
jgi:hypothetical protein